MFARLMAALGYVPQSEHDELYRDAQRLLTEYRDFRNSYQRWLVKYNANPPPQVPPHDCQIIPFRGRGLGL